MEIDDYILIILLLFIYLILLLLMLWNDIYFWEFFIPSSIIEFKLIYDIIKK